MTKEECIKAQLNCDKLTPLQWDGIMRAMDIYATSREHKSHPVTEMVTDDNRIFTQDDMLTVVDEAFHRYASFCRQDAKEYVLGWMRDRLTQPKSEWISVKNRLPEEGVYVLCCRNDKSGNHIVTGKLLHNNIFSCSMNWHSNVTHWMPLPQPPKQSEK